MDSIPSGWVLCDGDNDTPDLRSFFIVGAGDTYAPYDFDTSADHVHTVFIAPHTHSFYEEEVGDISNTPGYEHFRHVHDWEDEGTSNVKDNVPPYFAFAYIMKL